MGSALPKPTPFYFKLFGAEGRQLEFLFIVYSESPVRPDRTIESGLNEPDSGNNPQINPHYYDTL